MSFRRTLRAARHEAAHAVVGEELGFRVKSIFLTEPRTGSRGWCVFDGRSRGTVLTWAVVTAAGSVADQYWKYRTRRSFSKTDYAILCEAYPSGRDRAEICAAALSRVVHRKKAIDRVAKALVKRDLSGAEIRRLLRA